MLDKITNDNLYSFDIFDTLVTRRTATPQGIFAIIQEILLKDSKYFNIPLYVRENFYDYRVRAEQYQYSYNNCVNNYSDCSFDEIYQNFIDNFSLSEKDVLLLKELELETEYKILVPIQKNIDLLKDLITQNNKVVLISDMYHSSNTIRKWLLKFDNIFENITIYVSNEYKAKKRGGELYKKVKDIECVEFCNWQHIGDNIVSDVNDAKALGIKAIKYDYPALASYERFANDRSKSSSNMLILGCAKNLKLNSESSKYNIGASLTSPILVPYVLWVLKESIRKGYKTLYFIARDGYLLKEIADFIIKEKNIDIKTKYIYGSRLAWQGASFCVSLDNLEPIIKQYGINLEFLSNILDINVEDFIHDIPKDILKNKKNIVLENRNELYEYLKNNEEFISLLQKKNREKLINLTGYLKQEIDFSESDFAFVDLSGSGVTQNCLASVINTFYPKAINSFYFRNGQYKVKPINVNRYFYILRNDACAMLEILARAPHGQTIGYQYDESTKKYLPVFDENSELIQNWNFETYCKGIIDFAEEYLKLNDYIYFNDISSVLPNTYINWLIKHIDKEVSNELGSIIYDHVGKNEKEFAPIIRRHQAIMCVLGLSKIKTKNYSLSFSRSKTSTQKILKFAHKYNNIWQWLFYIHINKKKKVALIRILGIDITFKRLLGMEG